MARIMYDYQLADRIIRLSRQCVYYVSTSDAYSAITRAR